MTTSTPRKRPSRAGSGRLRGPARAVLFAATLGWVASCGGSDVPTGPVADPVATTIVLSTGTVTFVSLGDEAALAATVLDQDGAVMAAAPVAWASSDRLVADVDGGTVSARGPGTATITAVSGAASAEAAVVVTQEPVALDVTPDTVVLAGVGDTLRASGVVVDAAGYPVSGAVVEWSTDDPAVATVAAGLVTAVSVGATSLVATSGALASVVPVRVTVTPASLTLTPSEIELESLGDTLTVGAVVRDGFGSVIPDAGVAWVSGDEGVATVDGGLVRAVGVGEASVVASSGPAADTLRVTVRQLPSALTIEPDSVALSGPGDTLRVEAVVRDSGGSPIPDAVIGWVSRDASIATVSPTGLLTAAAAGRTFVVAVSGALSDSVAVRVTQTPASITLAPDSVPLVGAGDTARVVAVVRDAAGAVIVGAPVAWSTADETVATVSDSGLVTSVAAGTTALTATSGPLSANVPVVVEQPVPPPSFAQDVNEIFVRRGCTTGNCHGGGAGGLTLSPNPVTSYANLVNVASTDDPSILRVNPGDASNSYLIMRLLGRPGTGARMPLGGQPLSAEDMATIERWIDLGAPNN